MFIVLTGLTIWYMLLFGWSTFNHPFAVGDLHAWGAILLSPFTLSIFLFWFVCGSLGFVIFAARRLQFVSYRRAERLVRTRGRVMKLIDIPLPVASIALAVYGGEAGQLAPLSLGTILTFGLLLHFAEQWVRSYLA